MQQMLAASPTRSHAEPREIAEAALWLTSAGLELRHRSRSCDRRRPSPHNGPACLLSACPVLGGRASTRGSSSYPPRHSPEGFDPAMLFDFGQPTDGIFQSGFIVEDIDVAIEQFSARLKIGPWTTIRDVGPHGATYRGEPAQAIVHVAFGFSGHLVYELIQQVNDVPSPYPRCDRRSGLRLSSLRLRDTGVRSSRRSDGCRGLREHRWRGDA